MPTEDQIRSIIRDELTTHEEKNEHHFQEIKTVLVGDLSGRRGLMDRVESLEKSDAIRNRTVWAAVCAVGAAILHSVVQFFSTSPTH